jgi:hypothetical protein
MRESVAEAQALYDRIYDGLRGQIDERRQPILDALHRDGVATLRALAMTSASRPLSAESAAMMRSYLRGPQAGDLEAAETWMTLLPELLLELRQREEAERDRNLLLRDALRWHQWYVMREELSSRRLLLDWLTYHPFDRSDRYRVFFATGTTRHATKVSPRPGARPVRQVACAA